MYPATIIIWDDQSQIVAPEIQTVRTMPLYAAVITSDKGSEDWVKLSGQDWFDMYTVSNSVDFNRHGQPLLQAANAIQSGAEMLCKRICAEDAYLANIAITANVKTEMTQDVDKDGNPLYLDGNGNKVPYDTDPETGDVFLESESEKTTITYGYLSASNCKTMDEVRESIEEGFKDLEVPENSKTYLLYVITDNGRGESKKRIRITPNFTLSRNYPNYFMYDLEIIEASRRLGNAIHFVLDPDIVVRDTNMSLQYQMNTQNSQLKCYQYDDQIHGFMDDVASHSGMDDLDKAMGMDLLFGHNKKQRQLGNITNDVVGGVDLSIRAGQLVLNGSNGSFGYRPLEDPSYADMAALAFAGWNEASGTILNYSTGVYDTRIYDVDRYKIDAILDANYPLVVKHAIEQLAIFREDFMYFRDMGLENRTLEQIMLADYDNAHNKFCMTYCNFYDIIDPFSKKQITVTITYSMARMLVNTFNNGRNLPMAGIKHGFIITEAIRDTINFTPAICPGLNQKEELDTARINYANYINDELVVETLYTSQDDYTQLSFGNNVIAVQEVIKRIRVRAPAIRYSFIDGEDLANYKAAVEEIISPFKANFRRLEVTYLQDPYYTENKIFYAALAVQFRDFVQTEYFKITALGSRV